MPRGLLPKGDEKRDRILSFIALYKEQHDGLSPTLWEIMAATKMSQGAVVHHLDVLEKQGRLQRHRSNGLMIGGTWTPPESVLNL